MSTTQDRTKEPRVTLRGGWYSVTSCLLQTREEMKWEQTWRKGFKSLGHSVKLESRAGKSEQGSCKDRVLSLEVGPGVYEANILAVEQFRCGQLTWGQ